MLSFNDRLRDAVTECGAPLCIGLDPDLERIPKSIVADSDAARVLSFCLSIVEATAQSAAAYKPNLAFFEALGRDGGDVLERVCAAVRESGRLLVLDGKRGDIGNTGRKYAEAMFDQLGGDAATVAPYMGADSISPFLAAKGRCAFVLVATSNPGSADIQLISCNNRPLYRNVAELAVRTAEESPGTVGFVVGGTHPERLHSLRRSYPDVPFLVPGIGAQGGDVEAVLDANDGGPILVNSSRSILYASDGSDFARAAGSHAMALATSLKRRLL